MKNLFMIEPVRGWGSIIQDLELALKGTTHLLTLRQERVNSIFCSYVPISLLGQVSMIVGLLSLQLESLSPIQIKGRALIGKSPLLTQD